MVNERSAFHAAAPRRPVPLTRQIAHFTLHDLRRTFVTMNAKLGTPVHVTERLLNHASWTVSGVAAVYNRHSYQGEMRAAVDRFSDVIAGLLQAAPDEEDPRALIDPPLD